MKIIFGALLLVVLAAFAAAWANTVTTQPPASGSPWTFTYPTSPGTSGFVLSTDGTGVTSWISNAGTASTALSSLTAAAATHTIQNVNFAQTWAWGTLGANTALTLSSTGMTTGTLLALSNTDTAANNGNVLTVNNSEGGNSFGIASNLLSATNTGAAGYFSNATTNAGYAVYGLMNAHGNVGYVGYFINTDTGSDVNYGLVGETNASGAAVGVYGSENGASASGSAAGWFTNNGGGAVANYGLVGTTNATGAAYGVYGGETGASNTGAAGWFTNSGGGAVANYGLVGSTNATGAAYGVYGTITGSANTGYAGYFTNTATTGVNYGVYASAPSASGYAGYFSGNVYATGDITDHNVTSCAMLGTDANGKLICNTPAFVLISTQTASSSAALQWTGLGSSYTTVFLDCNGINPATNGANFEVQVGEGATPTWETAGYYSSYWYSAYEATTSGVNTGSNISSLVVAAAVSSTSGYNLSLKLWISSLPSTTNDKQMEFLTAYDNSSNNTIASSGGGAYYGDQGAVTALRVLFSSGNITAGQCSLYGMNH